MTSRVRTLQAFVKDLAEYSFIVLTLYAITWFNWLGAGGFKPSIHPSGWLTLIVTTGACVNIFIYLFFNQMISSEFLQFLWAFCCCLQSHPSSSLESVYFSVAQEQYHPFHLISFTSCRSRQVKRSTSCVTLNMLLAPLNLIGLLTGLKLSMCLSALLDQRLREQTGQGQRIVKFPWEQHNVYSL